MAKAENIRTHIDDWTFPRDKELADIVKSEYSNKTILSFSGGKDSIAVWLKLREYGFEVYPYQAYRIPGLEFVEKGLAFAEKFFGVRIARLPQPAFVSAVMNFSFQPPERTKIIHMADWQMFDYDDLPDAIARKHGFGNEVLNAVGVRAKDNLHRQLMIRKKGPINLNNLKWFPIWDYSRQKAFDVLNDNDYPLPVDYLIWGRSFDGLNYKFIGPLKKYFPKDYQTLLEWFPLAEAEIFRYEKMINNS